MPEFGAAVKIFLAQIKLNLIIPARTKIVRMEPCMQLGPDGQEIMVMDGKDQHRPQDLNKPVDFLWKAGQPTFELIRTAFPQYIQRVDFYWTEENCPGFEERPKLERRYGTLTPISKYYWQSTNYFTKVATVNYFIP